MGKFVDCQMCADYECLDFHESSSNGYYDEDGEYVEAELDDAMEWLNGFSECAETNAYLDDYLVYSNLMCNAEGTGLEVGLFLDEECLMYTSKLAFADIMQEAVAVDVADCGGYEAEEEEDGDDAGYAAQYDW